jgi:hypothetical protein
VFKTAGQTPALDRKLQNQKNHNTGLKGRVNNLHSIMGQLVKEFQRFQQAPDAENRQPNHCKGRAPLASNQSKEEHKGQAQGNQSKHFAVKAQAGPRAWIQEIVRPREFFCQGHSDDDHVIMIHCGIIIVLAKP